MASYETSAKEKEYSSSIFYLIVSCSIISVIIDAIWKFREPIFLQLGAKLQESFILSIKFLSKLQGDSGIFDGNTILYIFLLSIVIICVISQNKVNLNASKNKANLYIFIGFFIWIIPLLYSFENLGIIGFIIHISLLILSMIFIIKGGLIFNAIVNLPKQDLFNDINEQFPQNSVNLENEYSVGFKTQYKFNGEWREGYIPVINPFRATLVLGSQGSGKTYAVLNPAIWQSIFKGYAAVIYDFKFPDLTIEAYNALIKSVANNPNVFTTSDKSKPIIPEFVIIDFENLKYSNRCNPFEAKYLDTIDDAAQLTKTLMYNLNKGWIKNEDFWAKSAINYLTCIIWFLRLMEEKYEKLGKICDLPHAIELCIQNPTTLLRIMSRYEELSVYTTTFLTALENQAGSQIAGQVASAQTSLAPLSSKKIYWVMSGNDTDLIVNNPDNPKIICLGNTPTKSNVYGAALSIYTSVMMKMIYKHKKIKCGFFIDELPSMFLMGLDDFIATVRSYKIATWLGIQDFEQLVKGYGQDSAKVIINTCGTIFSGAVNNTTAENLSKMFGQTNQTKISSGISKGEMNLNHSNNLQSLVPASKISTLSQGNFVGKVADNFGEEIDLKLFKSYIHVETEELKKTSSLPLKWTDSDEKLDQAVEANYKKIKEDVVRIMDYESANIV